MFYAKENYEIIKSKLDTNLYKYKIFENGLKVLLISDKKADKSGCSLCVNVGSFDEPVEVGGLAHFLEHLLFMGTEKYPDENEYMTYLNMHNGNSNAYTCNETTNYYFDVSNKYFEGALDRFAQFFIKPLFKKESVDREISAVNSEFLGNVSNDNSRRHRLLQLCYKSHLEESRFNIGNTKTLKIDNIREKVIDFYQRTYQPERMIAVMYSSLDLEDLEKLADIFIDVSSTTEYFTAQSDTTYIEDFLGKKEACKKAFTRHDAPGIISHSLYTHISDTVVLQNDKVFTQDDTITHTSKHKDYNIPNTSNTDIKKNDLRNEGCKEYNKYISSVRLQNGFTISSQYSSDTELFKEECYDRLIKYKSIEDTKRIDVYIETLHPLISNNLFDTLSKDLVREDTGYIKILKDANLAYDVNTYIEPIKYYGLLEISIYLTDFGFENASLVIDKLELFFANYDMKKIDIERNIEHNKINFYYKEKEDVIDVIEEMSDNLTKVPYNHILDFEHSQVYPSYKQIQNVLENLKNRKKWIYIISSNKFDCKTEEPIFNFRYEIPSVRTT